MDTEGYLIPGPKAPRRTPSDAVLATTRCPQSQGTHHPPPGSQENDQRAWALPSWRSRYDHFGYPAAGQRNTRLCHTTGRRETSDPAPLPIPGRGSLAARHTRDHRLRRLDEQPPFAILLDLEKHLEAIQSHQRRRSRTTRRPPQGPPSLATVDSRQSCEVLASSGPPHRPIDHTARQTRAHIHRTERLLVSGSNSG